MFEENGILYHLKNYKLGKEVMKNIDRLNLTDAKDSDNLSFISEMMLKNNHISEGHLNVIMIKRKLAVLCTEIEGILPDKCHVGIFFWEENEKALYHGAGPTIPIDFYDLLPEIKGKITEDFTCCGQAIHKNKLVVSYIETDPSCKEVRKFYTRFNYKTLWAFPFHDNGRVAGTFGILCEDEKLYPDRKTIAEVNKKIELYEKEIKYLSQQLKKKNPAIINF